MNGKKLFVLEIVKIKTPKKVECWLYVLVVCLNNKSHIYDG
jgi:hypothetical protein